MIDAANDVSRGRRIAFLVVVGLLVLVLAVQWWVVVTPIFVWFPDGFVNDVFAPRVDEFSIHRIHRLALALSHVMVLVGLILQFRRPAEKKGPMWQTSAFFLFAIILNLVVRPTSEQLPPPLWIIFGLGVLAGILHPSSPLLHIPKVSDWRLGAMTLIMGIPMAIYALGQIGLQMGGVATDPHWVDSHYQFAGEFGFHLILVSLVSCTTFTGRRITAWMAGLAALLMGVASMVFPDLTSSLGVGWGLGLAVWGVVFVLMSERRARGAVMAGEATTQGSLADLQRS